MKFLKFSRKQTERGYEILKFLGARRFSLRTATTEFLNLTPAPSRNGFRNLKFTSVPRNRFEILKFTLALARLADTAQNFISRNGFKILKFIQELPFAPRRVLPRVDSAEAGRGCGIAEKRRTVKLAHASGYLNSARHYIARFCSAAVRHGYKVGREEKFSKFDLTGARLNFAFNSVPRASASKFENGVKFKGAAKFERSTR